MIAILRPLGFGKLVVCFKLVAFVVIEVYAHGKPMITDVVYGDVIVLQALI